MRSGGCQETANPFVTTIFGDSAFLTLRARASLYSNEEAPHMIHAFLTLGLAALALGSFAPGRQSSAATGRAAEARTRDVYVSVLGAERRAGHRAVRRRLQRSARTASRAKCSGPNPPPTRCRSSCSWTTARRDRRPAAHARGAHGVRRQDEGHGEIGIVTSATAPRRWWRRRPMWRAESAASIESSRARARAPTCSTPSRTSARASRGARPSGR